jgi:hypothetical protein
VKRLLVALALAAQACTAATPVASTPVPTATEAVAITAAAFAPTATATATDGGCGSTTVFIGGIPATLNRAAGDNAPSGVPYAVAHPASAAGFIFGYPLHTPSSGNKILWVVGARRTGDLVIDGVPLGKSAPAVHYSFPANSGPGEIYPSGVDVPQPGCWAFTLRFAGQVTQIELAYR